MGRTDSMAAIDAVLQNPQAIMGTATGGNSAAAAPHAAPGVTPQTPVTSGGKLSADEKRYIDAQRDEERQADKLVAQQQENKDAFQKSANATVNAVGGVVRDTGLTFAGLPTPGSLVLPLVVLLIFFFLLLPVNGHTRLVWIWLTLTGNAEIQQSGSSSNIDTTNNFGDGASGNFAPSTTGSTTTPSGNNSSNPTLSNPFANLVPIVPWLVDAGSVFMTGVEEIL